MHLIHGVVVFVIFNTCLAATRPNIIFIVGDDVGWNDVSWNNPSMITPSLNKLAKAGVILNSSYVQPSCSPSRAAFMTGYYPYHLGLQEGVIGWVQARGVPVSRELLSTSLKNQGYATHIVGKWHLGFCKWEYTPTFRNFDTFYGFYGNSEDYYNHSTLLSSVSPAEGFDFRFNTEVLRDAEEVYSTYLFRDRAVDIINTHDNSKPLFLYLPFQAPHAPVEVPKKYEDMYPEITDDIRRKYSGMVTAMDEAVGTVVKALEDKDLMENTLIIFTTDNGAEPGAGGSNLPLKGGKGTLWEGGTRGPAFVYSKTLLQNSGYISSGLIHAVDWYPTLVEAAGGIVVPDIDGVSQLQSILTGSPSIRTEFVYNLNIYSGAIRDGQYKLMYRNIAPDSPNNGTTLYFNSFDAGREYQLYDIYNDPCETTDILEEFPDIFLRLARRLEELKLSMVPSQPGNRVREADPRHYGGVWTPGWC